MTFLRRVNLVAVFFGLLSWSAHAEQNAPQRFALLIANSGYAPAVGHLQNPSHDVDIVESALLRIGFPRENVVKRVDVSGSQLLELVQSHVDRVKAAGEGTISLFYYTGHGAAAPPNTPGAEGNYIIPYDVESTARPDFWSRAVALDQVGKILREAQFAKHIVIFDACRTELHLPGKDIASRGFDPPLLAQDAEMLTAFSTAPRTIANDKLNPEDYNGPYASAFAENLDRPGLDHLRLFSNVRTQVVNITGHRQIPWTNDGLLAPMVLYPARETTTDKQTNCDNLQAVNFSVPALPIIWSEVPDKSWIRFKSHGYTYEAPRANAQMIEEVDEGSAQRIAPGSKIWVGTIGGKVEWYRYERNVGSGRVRHVIASETELF